MYTVREVAPVAPPVVVVPEIVTSTPAVSTNWLNSLFALFSKKCGNKLNINLSINLFTYLFTCLLFVFYLSIFLLNPQVIKTNYLNNSQNKIRIRFPMSVFIFPLLFSDHFPYPNNEFPTLSHSFLCNSVTLIPAPSLLPPHTTMFDHTDGLSTSTPKLISIYCQTAKYILKTLFRGVFQ